MPWKEASTVSLREAFVEQALEPGANLSQLCRNHGISRKTGYKWLDRYRQTGIVGLQDQSRRPRTSPKQTKAEVEAIILETRAAHPTWGGYKIKAYLQRKGWERLPAHSTIHAILKRNGQIDPEEGCKHKAFEHFEMSLPNQLWQMDFKGHFALPAGGRCHPLSVLDDHSRFLLGLRACGNETKETVQQHLSDIFRSYGLPERILMDNGSPWGDSQGNPYTAFGAWLIRLGIRISHGRPYHPQTQGKAERLHRTLQEDLLQRQTLDDLDRYQEHFDAWREVYNQERPHAALDMAVPADRYQPSSRNFPEVLPPIIYDPHASVRMVDKLGRISFQGRIFRVGKAFIRYPVAIVPTEIDGDYEVYFCQQRVAQISFRGDNC